MLAAAGTVDLTPFTLQADIMNGVDPAPQDVTLEDSLFSKHLVKVFVYNQQVTDTLTASFLADARRYGVPVVGVYETMPTPGYDYQSWMLAEINGAAQGRRRRRSRRRSCEHGRSRRRRQADPRASTGSASAWPAATSCARSASRSTRASSPG